MILVDTSVWIEFFRVHSPVFEQLRNLIEEERIVAVECVFGELLQGARNRSEREFIVKYWEALPKIDEAGLWIRAGRLSGEHSWKSSGLGLIDAFLAAAAKTKGIPLWSTDKSLRLVLSAKECYAPD